MYFNGIILLFSFFLGFGLFDPFKTNGLFFDSLTLLTVITITLNKRIINNLNLIKLEFILLLGIAIIFYFMSLIYYINFADDFSLNFKFIFAIIIFSLLSIVFQHDRKLSYWCILLFSISCGIIAFLFQIGTLDDYIIISKSDAGRISLFGENPNSLSSRMAISFIILFYNLIFDPLSFKKKRFIIILLLIPILNLIIFTASRGSSLFLGISIFIIIFLSNIKINYKIIVLIASSFFLSLSFSLLKDTPLIKRFLRANLVDNRQNIWRNSLKIFENNIWGLGENGFKKELSKITFDVLDTHNLFLYLLVCGGPISIILFIIFLIRVFKISFNTLLINKNILPLTILFFLVLLMTKTGGIITYLVMWYFLAFIMSHKNSTFNINKI